MHRLSHFCSFFTWMLEHRSFVLNDLVSRFGATIHFPCIANGHMKHLFWENMVHAKLNLKSFACMCEDGTQNMSPFVLLCNSIPSQQQQQKQIVCNFVATSTSATFWSHRTCTCSLSKLRSTYSNRTILVVVGRRSRHPNKRVVLCWTALRVGGGSQAFPLLA